MVDDLLVLTVFSEAAREGTPLYEENRFEVRFEVSCVRNQC